MAKRTRKSIKNNLDKLAMKVVRERDNWTCQHCGKREENPQAIHCSHVIPKSRGDALRWDLQNLKLLCFHCHINWWHKNPLEASEWFREKFPERASYLEGKKHEVIKFTLEDLLEMELDFKRLLSE